MSRLSELPNPSIAAGIMNDMDWLANRHFREVIRYEHSWAFAFEDGVGVTAECLWRLIENGRIRFTSEDDGHQFGLPAPRDCGS